MATWQVQQAKSRFSELIDEAQTKGPQIITKHGVESVAVISMEQFRAFRKKQPEQDLIHFLLHEGPKFDEGDNPFENLRDPNDIGRDIDL